MRKVIYNEDGVITGVSNDPREDSDVFTDLSDDEIFDYKVVDGQLVYSPRFSLTLDELKAKKTNEAEQKFSGIKKAKESKYMDEEKETFPDQKVDALIYFRASAEDKNDSTLTPVITRMAKGNEPFRIALLNAILENIWSVAEAQGEMVMTRDAIKACTTVEALNEIII